MMEINEINHPDIPNINSSFSNSFASDDRSDIWSKNEYQNTPNLLIKSLSENKDRIEEDKGNILVKTLGNIINNQESS